MHASCILYHQLVELPTAGFAGCWLQQLREDLCLCVYAVLVICVCVQVMYALPQGPDPLEATIGECGAMNLFFVFDKTQHAGAAGSNSSSGGGADSVQQQQLEVVTPPLDGTILPGVTRDSILQLLRK